MYSQMEVVGSMISRRISRTFDLAKIFIIEFSNVLAKASTFCMRESTRDELTMVWATSAAISGEGCPGESRVMLTLIESCR